MESGVDDAARYTSSEEEQNRPASTTKDRVVGKRPLAVEPSPTEALPVETSVADDEDEEEAAPSLIRRPRNPPDVAPITAGRVTSDPPAPHTEPTQLGGAEAAAATGRTRRTFFAATHRRSDL